MIHRVARLAHEGQPLVVVLNAGAGQPLLGDVRAEGRRIDDPAQHLQAVDHGAAVVLGVEVVVEDGGRLRRVARAQAHPAARLRVQLRERAREARVRVQVAAALGHREVDEVELAVGAGELGAGAHEGGGVAGAHGQGPAALDEPLQAHAGLAPDRRHVVVERDGLRAAVHAAHVEVVLEVLADLGAVVHHRDAELLQALGGADARELQQLRRIDRAAREDDLGRALGAGDAALAVLDADRAPALEDDARGERLGLHAQVRALHRRTQVADRGAHPPAVLRGGLVVARALLALAVEVVVAGNAVGLAGGDEGVAHLEAVGNVGDGERAADAVPRVGAPALVLGLLEEGQQLGPGPSGDLPAVEVLGLAADVDEPVDGRRTAQHLAARGVDAPAVERRLRLRLVRPVHVQVVEQLAVAERNVDPRVGVARAGLEQQHLAPPPLGEAIGEHAAGRAGADDDGVVGVHDGSMISWR